jgi:hypothetical protein
MNEPSYAARDRGRSSASARRDSVRIDPSTGPAALVTQRNLLGLQRLAGNRAVADRMGEHPSPGDAILQRLALEDGPPLAPGNYRYGEVIVALKPGAIRATLTDMAAGNGLAAEERWQQAFVTDMRAQGAKHSYEDPDAKQTVSVEPTLADRADEAQTQIIAQVGAIQTQFQQSMLNSVRDLLSTSEKKLYAEGHRYGFPDDESIFQPKPLSAMGEAITPSMPGSDDLRGIMAGAKQLLDGKHKLQKARDTIAASGPILGDAMRPTVLEPAVRDYHTLRTTVCTQFPLLAAIEREDDRLAEMASGAGYAAGGATGPAAAAAMVKAKDEIRKELADKLSNISYIRAGMDEPDKVDKFWLDHALRENTKRSMGIGPTTLQNAAVEDKAKNLQEDAEFEAKLKQALGVGLLIASFVPGVAPVAGAVGLVVGAVDVATAFQEYYWEQAAAGTAMEKAEAISQTEPSLFGLAVSIAIGMLEGVAEVKALEGAIDVFKIVGAAYREARAAGVAAEMASGAAKTTAAAELATATEKLKTTADQASGKPGLGNTIVAGLPADIRSTARSLDQSLKVIRDPGLKTLILRSEKPVTAAGETLMDLAIKDPASVIEDFAEWQKSNSGKPFEDWLGGIKKMPDHGILNEPAGLVEYGLKEGEARSRVNEAIQEDPTREVGVWRDPETGEHVVVQGGPGFVEFGWASDVENLRSGKLPKWELVLHHHPNRGIAIDRLPSEADFSHIAPNQAAGAAAKPVTSSIVWTDPASKLNFHTEFGFVPGAERPYWTRYRVEDGTFRIASFKDASVNSTEYSNFISTFTGNPTDPVPGGNVMPEALPEPPPTVRTGPPRP